MVVISFIVFNALSFSCLIFFSDVCVSPFLRRGSSDSFRGISKNVWDRERGVKTAASSTSTKQESCKVVPCRAGCQLHRECARKREGKVSSRVPPIPRSRQQPFHNEA